LSRLRIGIVKDCGAAVSAAIAGALARSITSGNPRIKRWQSARLVHDF
jgi:hypothetical protein